MTSLGSYAKTGTLDCNTLVTNDIKTNGNVLTSVYNQLILSAVETVTGTLAPLKKWIVDANVGGKGVTIDSTTGQIKVSETGLYMVNFSAQLDNAQNFTNLDVELNKTPKGGVSTLQIKESYNDSGSQATARISRATMNLSFLLKINDVDDSFDLEARVAGIVAGSASTAQTDGTVAQIIKIL
tara:strand:- start:22 stop:570 length:549 start_codon:yes stop_codon:yes gene_type:complete